MARRRSFGATWWGEAWVEALEQRAALDPNRLPRGRTYARQDRVGALVVEPGLVSAAVRGSRLRPYRVTVRVATFDASQWDRLLDAVAAQAGHAAALLDGELEPQVRDDVAAAGLDLLPGAGEVQPRCTCPDWADPCKHSAAVCYLVADALDTDPFTLLRLRGRSREEVLAGVRARRVAAGTGGTGDPAGVVVAASGGEDDGVLAGRLYAAWSSTAPGVHPALPPLPRPPDVPGRPAPLPVDPPLDTVAAADLSALAADAAARAWALLSGGDAGLGLSKAEDLARRAAAALGPRTGGVASASSGSASASGSLSSGSLSSGSSAPSVSVSVSPSVEDLARAASVPGRRLLSDALAWRHGGAAGLAALRGEPVPVAHADRLEASYAVGLGARVRLGRVSTPDGSVQLRRGPDGLWHPFRRRGTEWEHAGPPSADPAEALAVARRDEPSPDGSG